MKCIILAGGKGTRLGEQDVPKSLMKFNKHTILEQNIKALPKNAKLIYILGYKADVILKYLTEKDIETEYITEYQPCGTGGWLNDIKYDNNKYSIAFLNPLSKNFIVCNGDNLIDINWSVVLKSHKQNNALVTLIVKEETDVSDKGCIKIDNDNRIIDFKEKTGTHEQGLISTGFYIFNEKVFDYIKANIALSTDKISLETDIFPKLIKSNKVFAYVHIDKWADTGTIERIKEAEKMFNVEN